MAHKDNNKCHHSHCVLIRRIRLDLFWKCHLDNEYHNIQCTAHHKMRSRLFLLFHRHGMEIYSYIDNAQDNNTLKYSDHRERNIHQKF